MHRLLYATVLAFAGVVFVPNAAEANPLVPALHRLGRGAGRPKSTPHAHRDTHPGLVTIHIEGDHHVATGSMGRRPVTRIFRGLTKLLATGALFVGVYHAVNAVTPGVAYVLDRVSGATNRGQGWVPIDADSPSEENSLSYYHPPR
jgi:hypothetical protein